MTPRTHLCLLFVSQKKFVSRQKRLVTQRPFISFTYPFFGGGRYTHDAKINHGFHLKDLPVHVSEKTFDVISEHISIEMT